MNYSQEIVQKVWEKAKVARAHDPFLLRKDLLGAWILRNQFQNRESEYGWEIDWIKPLEEGGKMEISNLRPLQWENKAFREGNRFNGMVTALMANNLRVK